MNPYGKHIGVSIVTAFIVLIGCSGNTSLPDINDVQQNDVPVVSDTISDTIPDIATDIPLLDTPCIPQCQNKECGPDLCGTECGNCEDDNVCTADGCSEDGLCTHEPLDIACDDGDLETTEDWCTNGVCIGKAPPGMLTVTFVVDATGSQFPLNSYGELTNPPPPDGDGKLFIFGNNELLGQWTPNNVQMTDDGTAGDATAADNFWTFSVSLPKGTSLLYKYSAGHEGDSYAGTEEFPLTQRGLELSLSPDYVSARVSDVFADRPQTDGSQAMHTTVMYQ